MLPDYKLIGSNICRIRHAKGFTQAELSRKLYISSGYISQIERGITKTNLTIIYSISDFLGCSIRDIIPGEKEYNNEQSSDESHGLIYSKLISDYIAGLFGSNTVYVNYYDIMKKIVLNLTDYQRMELCYTMAAFMAVNNIMPEDKGKKQIKQNDIFV